MPATAPKDEMPATPRSTTWNAAYNAAVADVCSFLRDRAVQYDVRDETHAAVAVRGALAEVQKLQKTRTK